MPPLLEGPSLPHIRVAADTGLAVLSSGTAHCSVSNISCTRPHREAGNFLSYLTFPVLAYVYGTVANLCSLLSICRPTDPVTRSARPTLSLLTLHIPRTQTPLSFAVSAGMATSADLPRSADPVRSTGLIGSTGLLRSTCRGSSYALCRYVLPRFPPCSPTGTYLPLSCLRLIHPAQASIAAMSGASALSAKEAMTKFMGVPYEADVAPAARASRRSGGQSVALRMTAPRDRMVVRMPRSVDQISAAADLPRREVSAARPATPGVSACRRERGPRCGAWKWTAGRGR